MANKLRQFIDIANATIGIDYNRRVNEWNNKTAEIIRFTKEEVSHLKWKVYSIY